MRIRAKKGGELNLHGFGIHWIHKAGDERDFPEDVGKRILTNENYEKAGARQPTAEKEITSEVVVKKTEKETGKKEKKEKEGSK